MGLALIAPGLVVPPSAQASGGSATIGAMPSQITVGGQIVLAGLVSADPGCAGGRAVTLQSQHAGEATWADIDRGTTAPDGSFAFAEAPQFSASYRAFLPLATSGGVTCDPITSGQTAASVAAKVDAALSSATVAAGDCVEVTVSVQPPKPGQTVQVEQQAPSGWQIVALEALDPSSVAGARVCFGWSSIGPVQLRAEWPSQDNLNLGATGPQVALDVTRAAWMDRIDGIAAGHAVSVSVAEAGTPLYELADSAPRTPASNEKLLLSMALLDEIGPDFRIVTHAAAAEVVHGVVRGDLWILGRGDPTIDGAKLDALASAIAGAGVRRIDGSVMGSTGYFDHDWFAPGWRPEFPREFIALPSALTFGGNTVNGVNVSDPERLAAASLTKQLESRGVAVTGRPGAGPPPAGLHDVATISSAPLAQLLRRQNVNSINFFAEVLGKLLGTTEGGVPGTIAKGATAVGAWAAAHGVNVTARDGSGLSYQDRATAGGIVRLLGVADDAAWGPALRASLPPPGQGTLEDRLAGVQVRAKTGTLTNISALSGWVFLKGDAAWAEFSILSSGLSKDRAVSIEDAIVRTLWGSAH